MRQLCFVRLVFFFIEASHTPFVSNTRAFFFFAIPIGCSKLASNAGVITDYHRKGTGGTSVLPVLCHQRCALRGGRVDRALDKRARGIYQRAHMSSPNLDVRDVARLARIELNDEEAATFQSQLGSVLEYVEQLGRLDVSGVEPTAHANPVFNVFREDIVRPGLDRAAVLANAPHTANNLVVVTKVIE